MQKIRGAGLTVGENGAVEVGGGGGRGINNNDGRIFLVLARQGRVIPRVKSHHTSSHVKFPPSFVTCVRSTYVGTLKAHFSAPKRQGTNILRMSTDILGSYSRK